MSEAYTAQGLTTQAVQSILSYAAPDLAASPASAWLSSMITSPMMRMLGINDPLTPILATNMTSSGVDALRIASRINQMSSAFSSQISHDILANRLRDLELTRTGGYRQWSRSHSGDEDYYNAMIDSEVDAWFRRPGFESMYNMANQALGFDPTSLSASKLMGQTAGNVLRRGIYLGGREYASLSMGTLRRLFENDEGKAIRFNNNDWNGFNQAGVASIAELLTRETDILNGIDTSGNISDKAKEAGERFKKKVKDLTEALAPLKDVFGNDVSKMVSIIEDLTGQSAGSINSSRLRSLSANIADRINSGLYTTEEMQAFNMQMTARMANMPGLSPYNYISGASQTFRVLDMLKGAQQPDSLTNRQWQSAAMSFVSETTNSGAADLYAKAYSVWAHKQGGGDTSTAAFDEAVAKFGGDRRHAWVQAAGLSFAAEADEGLGYSYYRQAIESGDAGRASGYAMLDRMITLGKHNIGLNSSFMKAVDVSTSEDARNIYAQVIQAVEGNPDIRNMSEKDRLAYLTKQYDGDEGLAGRINRGLTFMEGKRGMKHILNLTSLRSGEKKMAEANANAAARRERLEKLESRLWDPAEGIVTQLIKGGFSLSNIKTALEQGNDIDKAGDLESVTAILAAAGSGAADWYGEDAEGKKSFISAFYNYAMSGEAMANEDFNSALEEYKKLSKLGPSDDNKAAMDKARNIMVGFMDVGADKMQEFLNSSRHKDKTGDMKDENISQLGAILKGARGSGVKVRTKDAMNMVIAENRVAQLNDPAVKSLLQAYKETGLVDRNGDGVLAFGEGFSEYYEANKDKGEDTVKALDKLKDVMQGLGGTASPGLESILNTLNTAVNKLIEVLGGKEKDKTVVDNKNTATTYTNHKSSRAAYGM